MEASNDIQSLGEIRIQTESMYDCSNAEILKTHVESFLKTPTFDELESLYAYLDCAEIKELPEVNEVFSLDFFKSLFCLLQHLSNPEDFSIAIDLLVIISRLSSNLLACFIIQSFPSFLEYIDHFSAEEHILCGFIDIMTNICSEVTFDNQCIHLLFDWIFSQTIDINEFIHLIYSIVKTQIQMLNDLIPSILAFLLPLKDSQDETSSRLVAYTLFFILYNYPDYSRQVFDAFSSFVFNLLSSNNLKLIDSSLSLLSVIQKNNTLSEAEILQYFNPEQFFGLLQTSNAFQALILLNNIMIDSQSFCLSFFQSKGLDCIIPLIVDSPIKIKQAAISVFMQMIPLDDVNERVRIVTSDVFEEIVSAISTLSSDVQVSIINFLSHIFVQSNSTGTNLYDHYCSSDFIDSVQNIETESQKVQRAIDRFNAAISSVNE